MCHLDASSRFLHTHSRVISQQRPWGHPAESNLLGTPLLRICVCARALTQVIVIITWEETMQLCSKVKRKTYQNTEVFHTTTCTNHTHTKQGVVSMPPKIIRQLTQPNSKTCRWFRQRDVDAGYQMLGLRPTAKWCNDHFRPQSHGEQQFIISPKRHNTDGLSVAR